MLSNMFDKTFRKGSSFCSIDGGVKCRVQTAEGELEFNIHPTTTGKQLFEEVTETLGLHESWFFGLQYKDSHERVTWIELDKKILRQIDVPTPEKPPTLQLCVKFYPEDVNEFIQESTVVGSSCFFNTLKYLENVLSPNQGTDLIRHHLLPGGRVYSVGFVCNPGQIRRLQ